MAGRDDVDPGRGSGDDVGASMCRTTPRNRVDPATAERPSVGDRRVIYWVECSCGWRSDEHFDFMAPDDEAAAHLEDHRERQD